MYYAITVNGKLCSSTHAIENVYKDPIHAQQEARYVRSQNPQAIVTVVGLELKVIPGEVIHD